MGMGMGMAMTLTLTVSYPLCPHPSALRCFRLSSSFAPLVRNLAISCSASNKNGRASRAAMSDEELCTQLRQFLFAMGLPEDHVPSTKDLTQNGRKDLANIVRRKGYKKVKTLLQNWPNTSFRQDSINSVGNRTANLLPKSIPVNDAVAGDKILAYTNGAVSGNTHAHVTESIHYSIEPLQLKLPRFASTAQIEKKQGENHSCDVDMASKDLLLDDQKEIDRLKRIVNEKEIELSQLKRQIEDEKLALYDLQLKTEAEIGNIQRAIAEKDLELQAAEESLNGLKEVHIDYVANAQEVELAGSFNGWQHKIKMDLHPSVLHQYPSEARKQALWSTVLWLYPGVYEIKFVVDGHWTLDNAREITTSGFSTNNVLRVDR